MSLIQQLVLGVYLMILPILLIETMASFRKSDQISNLAFWLLLVAIALGMVFLVAGLPSPKR